MSVLVFQLMNYSFIKVMSVKSIYTSCGYAFILIQLILLLIFYVLHLRWPQFLKPKAAEQIDLEEENDIVKSADVVHEFVPSVP